MISQTYTYATLEISSKAYVEIYNKLKAAGYDHAFIGHGKYEVIDMNGIGLTETPHPERKTKK